ncbi:MAG: asparagine synthase (glutamine-hydrolyzing) [Chthoniobacterales bacterium]|nr:MAG: asparagine synthase (glutamine-hydrolyzing) [Chthoniobacterales bacterium]
MCGICGQFNFASESPVESEMIHRMTQTMAHRGPDDEGYFVSGSLGLGFRRLSIIDLEGGHQPMFDLERTVCVVFNGEIYNYKELRQELASRGHSFRTNSDTEVIIYGYKEWGTQVLSRLNGMFGLAIWDLSRERLVIARDAMGIKMIYYRLDHGSLRFGSEIRPIIAGDVTKPEVDPSALKLFLRFRYTPSPLTIFRGVRKLAAGTMLVVEAGTCRQERWYNYTAVPFDSRKDEREVTEELLELYRAAVKRHLLSDVPLGILLSGGLDSGLLLALMNEHGGPWPAYTVGYGSSFKDDELADAAETARLLHARHVTVELNRDEFVAALPHIVASLEEPVASSSVVPMYFISQRARQDVKVGLIGQGPDELFGGYTRHLGVRYGDWWRWMPGPLRSSLTSAVGQLPRNAALKRGVHSLGIADRLERYQQVFSIASTAQIDSLFQDDLNEREENPDLVGYWHDLLPQMAGLDELGGFQLIEIRSSLPDELLMYADKLSMAHSLEARVPYLDRTIVEYAQRLDASYKVRNGSRKWLHRRVCEKFLPPEILQRKKRGFAVNVVDGWFNSLQSDLSEVLTSEDSLMFETLELMPVRKLLDDHRAGRHDNHKLLFSLVMFEQWLRGMHSTLESVREPSAAYHA